jgi:TPR repeat protein
MPSTFANDALAAIVMNVSRLLTGVVIAILLSTSSALAGASEDCAAAAVNVHGQQDYAKALRLCRPLAEQGDAKAQYALGFMYTNGEGVQEDHTEAALLYRQAANQGYAVAQSTLGFMYNFGRGVPQDYAEAEKWYRKAAEQGDAFGQSYLGFMYELGDGLPRNDVLAHMWFSLAAAHSRADFADYGNMADLMYDAAKSNAEMRDRLANKMTPEQIAEAQRLAREWKPTK